MSSDDPDYVRRGQDVVERHAYSEIEKVSGAGHIVRVKGTDTEDEEAHVLFVGGAGMNMPKDTNAEVILISGGSDTSQKYAVMMIPRDKEHAWPEGFSGLQYWNDPERRMQFGKKRAHLRDKNVAIGTKGNFEVTSDGDTVYIRGKKIVFEVAPIIGTPGFEEETS